MKMKLLNFAFLQIISIALKKLKQRIGFMSEKANIDEFI